MNIKAIDDQIMLAVERLDAARHGLAMAEDELESAQIVHDALIEAKRYNEILWRKRMYNRQYRRIMRLTK